MRNVLLEMQLTVFIYYSYSFICLLIGRVQTQFAGYGQYKFQKFLTFLNLTIRKREFSKVYSILLHFEENRKGRNNKVLVLKLICYLYLCLFIYVVIHVFNEDTVKKAVETVTTPIAVRHRSGDI